MDLFDIAVARKLSSGGGGGSSSDFSIATVTINIIDNPSSRFGFPAAYAGIFNDELTNVNIPMYNETESYSQEIILYKGSAVGYWDSSVYISSSSSCIWDIDSSMLTITGDCTVTVNACIME